jgi:hypothetical protein
MNEERQKRLHENWERMLKEMDEQHRKRRGDQPV